MYILNNDKMLPEIFLDTKQLFEKVSQDLVALKENLMADNQQARIKEFFEQYVKFQMRGLQIFKNSMGDLCVGLKALGNKFGALGGKSFELLSATSDKVIELTGDFINFVTSYIVSTELIMQESEQNVEDFLRLAQNVQNYFDSLIPLFKDLSDATTHMYGDAKNRLKDRFASVENSLVTFIHRAKIKVVSALANALVGVKLGYDYFNKLAETNAENIYEDNILNEQEEPDNQLIIELLNKIVVNFDEALNQAVKNY